MAHPQDFDHAVVEPGHDLVGGQAQRRSAVALGCRHGRSPHGKILILPFWQSAGRKAIAWAEISKLCSGKHLQPYPAAVPTPAMPIPAALQPVDLRRRIDSLTAFCRRHLEEGRMGS